MFSVIRLGKRVESKVCILNSHSFLTFSAIVVAGAPSVAQAPTLRRAARTATRRCTGPRGATCRPSSSSSSRTAPTSPTKTNSCVLFATALPLSLYLSLSLSCNCPVQSSPVQSCLHSVFVCLLLVPPCVLLVLCFSRPLPTDSICCCLFCFVFVLFCRFRFFPPCSSPRAKPRWTGPRSPGRWW